MRVQLPDVTIPFSQRKPLKRLVAEAFSKKDRVAPFLSAELRRANFCEDDALAGDIVAVGRHVSYRLGWGPPTSYRTLVYPEDLHDDEREISVLSPIGTALLGLKVGDRTQVFLEPKGFQVLQVENVWPEWRHS
jgi:transcription elongation GreA/GreB family factor